MKKHLFSSLVVILMAFCLSSCEKPFGAEVVDRIWVKNESATTIAYLFSYNYPDTTIPDTYNKIRGCPVNTRVPNDSKNWDKVFANEIPGGKLIVFVFDKPVYQQNWQQIRSNYAVAKRYELSLEDLNTINWTITYP